MSRRRSGRSTSRRRPIRRCRGGAWRRALTKTPHVRPRCELRRRSGAGLRHRLGRGSVRAGRRGQPLYHRCRGVPRRAAGMDDEQSAEARQSSPRRRTGASPSCRRRPSASTASPASPITPRMYLDRDGKVQTVAYRMPEAKKAEGQGCGGRRRRWRTMCRIVVEATSRRDAQGHRDDRRFAHRCAARGAAARADRGRHADGVAGPRLRRPERLGRVRHAAGPTTAAGASPAMPRALFDQDGKLDFDIGHAPRRGALDPDRRPVVPGEPHRPAASSPASPAT